MAQLGRLACLQGKYILQWEEKGFVGKGFVFLHAEKRYLYLKKKKGL